jgi:hypothetical protein
MLKTPHCLSNRLTDGGKVVSLTHRTRSTPKNIIFLFLVSISVRGWVNARAYCGRKDNVNWKISFTSSDLEPNTSRVVAQCPNHYATVCPHKNVQKVMNSYYIDVRIKYTVLAPIQISPSSPSIVAFMKLYLLQIHYISYKISFHEG